jgi:hypothetical protein
MGEQQAMGEGKERPQQEHRLPKRIAQRPGLGRKITPKIQPDRPQTTSEINLEEEIIIFPQLQQKKYDCGQTVLDMLGYKGHEMYPNQEIESRQLRKLSGVKEVTLPVGREEELDYNDPKVWIILGKGRVAGAQHWIIRHKNIIYCPTVGKMNALEYKSKYVSSVLQEFEIPVKGQQTPNEYYRQHDIALPKVSEIEPRVETSLPSERKSKEKFAKYGSREWAKQLAQTTN